MNLYVYQSYDDTEEERDLGECADTKAADEMIASFTETDEEFDGEWSCAELFDDRHKVVCRRTPGSLWVDARYWPEKASLLPRFKHDVDRIAAWLGECGFAPEWDAVLRLPFPGRERGEINRNLLDPFATLRDMQQHGRDPVESIVSVILQEGIERGALFHRETHNCDTLDARLERRDEDNRQLREVNGSLRAEIARIKGEQA